MRVTRSGLANGVSVLSAFFSVLPLSCCMFPIALSLIGASGMAFAEALMPYRPYFIGLSLVSLAAAFYFTYRSGKNCVRDDVCASPVGRRFQIVLLLVITALVLLLLIFPYLVPFLPI